MVGQSPDGLFRQISRFHGCQRPVQNRKCFVGVRFFQGFCAEHRIQDFGAEFGEPSVNFVGCACQWCAVDILTRRVGQCCVYHFLHLDCLFRLSDLFQLNDCLFRLSDLFQLHDLFRLNDRFGLNCWFGLNDSNRVLFFKARELRNAGLWIICIDHSVVAFLSSTHKHLFCECGQRRILFSAGVGDHGSVLRLLSDSIQSATDFRQNAFRSIFHECVGNVELTSRFCFCFGFLQTSGRKCFTSFCDVLSSLLFFA